MANCDAELLQQLRGLLGQLVNYKGQQHEINEVLEESAHGAALVLKCLEGSGTIQGDYHGEAHRRTPELILLPVADDQGQVSVFVQRLLTS